MVTNLRDAFTGYHQAEFPAPPEITEVTRVSPRTPCGEYMRRFWHPIALSVEVTDLPHALRVLNEDLVLFRQPSGQLGLVHRHCVHRGTSLEYGRVEANGIRCCYHGWLYAANGEILETPMEPKSSPIRSKVRLGAYPVREYRGLIFAYMGPPQYEPEFPIYDTFETPETTYLAAGHRFEANWFHLIENNFDMAHSVYLHTLFSGNAQFYDTWGVVPQMEYYETDLGYRYTYSRRIDSKVWVGLEDINFPNFTQAGAIFSMDGKTTKYFGRGSYSRWVVPVDDVNTRIFVLGHFNDLSDPFDESYREAANLEIMEVGTRFERSYEERQREPSDIEAAGSQGKIYLRRNEHLATTDRGIALFRKRIRQQIQALVAGEEPNLPGNNRTGLIPTCAGDIVLEIPVTPNDGARVAQVARGVMGVYNQSDNLFGTERQAHIEQHTKNLEENYRLR